MIPNKRDRILAGLLAIALMMPLLIKSEHLIFSDHDHDFHCHSCEDLQFDHPDSHCKILEFDYFFFTPAKLFNLHSIPEFSLVLEKEAVQDLFTTSLKLSYALRAPPAAEFFPANAKHL